MSKYLTRGIPNHRLLVSKLEKYGVTGKLLDWISNFLQGRVQTVGVDQVFSKFKEVLSGVPQGSVLGPVLFLVYVIDLESSLIFSDALTFADDTKIVKVIRGILDHSNLQEDLCNVVEWSVLNNMTLHDDKFELVRYSPRSYNLLRELPFTAGFLSYETPSGVCLTSTPVVKDLGVLLSEDGSWKPQIEKVSSAASRVSNWILGAFKCRSVKVMMTLYKTLVRPILEYCSAVWNPSAIGEIAQLEQVQRNFTRRILGCKHLDYWERLEFLDLQSLQRRRERYVLIHMFKIWKGLAPNGPGFDFRDTPRSGPRAVIPKFNHRAQRSASTMFENSFSVHGAKLWNTLPKGAKEAGSVDELKVVLGENLRGIADRVFMGTLCWTLL